MMKQKYIYISALSFLLMGCSDDTMYVGGVADYQPGMVRLQAEIDQVNVTRADDSGFADGDRIGVFAVSFTEDMNPGFLAPTGNLADNVRFTFNESSYSWKGDRELYFLDDKTPVDFYGCYPYNPSVDDVESYPFSVERNQAAESVGYGLSGYEASDFLWAKTPAVLPSDPYVNLMFKHILSAVQVTLLEGESFDDGEWTTLDKDVMVANTKRNAFINLSSGDVTAIGEKDGKAIAMNPHNNDFRAIVVPQSVDAGQSVISVTVGGHSYELVKSETMTYVPSKLHKFTIHVDKASENGDYEFTLVDESITAWESDGLSHDGKVKEYLMVEVPAMGGLENAVKSAGLDPEEIINLKIKGEMNQDDFNYMRQNFTYLEALNLKDVLIYDCDVEYGRDKSDFSIPWDGCNGLLYLKTVVFPERLKAIGSNAFRNTNLTGSLDFPEGLEYIGESAFSNWQAYTSSNTNLSGTLTLPSTLKHIGSSAFENCDFTGNLIIPEGLEYVGESAFKDCENLTGELHLPSSLMELGRDAFSNTGFTGNFIIPRHLTEIKAFMFPKTVSFSWPDAPQTIGEEAFALGELRGDLIIPKTVTKIGARAFTGTKLSHIVFPDNLEFIEENVCSWNRQLLDTIVIPPLIETIEENAFSWCDKLDAVVLPKRLQRIKGSAFENCFSLTYIHCQAVEPPALEESAFYGVNKDNFTVEVPEESVDAYRNAPGWSEFKRISAYKNFVARPSKYNVLNKGGKKEIILNADSKWEMTECPSWCHIDKTSGSMKTVLTLTVDAMAHGQAPRNGIITFRLDDADQHLTHINVGQYDYEYDEDESIQLQKATKGKGINIFFVGDGYDAIDISNGLYLKDMNQELEYLFAVEPYTTYREYFNVYTAFALSEDSGVESLNRWRTTKFHSSIGDGTTRLSADWTSAMDYSVATVPAFSANSNPEIGVILVVNSDMYEGVTYAMTEINSFCAVVTKSTLDYPNDARGLIQHEAGGHGLGWLADEYMYHQAFISKCQCFCCGHVDALMADQSAGFGLNLSLNGKYKEVPWSHLIFNKNYGDIVDIYEGGYFHSRGVYRSEYNSCMNNNVPYFSTWSRQLIVQRIMKLAGEPFDLDSFYAKDSRATGRDFTGTTRSGINDASAYSPKGQAPQMIKNFKFKKKGGIR